MFLLFLVIYVPLDVHITSNVHASPNEVVANPINDVEGHS